MSATALRYAMRFGYGPSPLRDLPRGALGYLDALHSPDLDADIFPVPGYDLYIQHFLAYSAGRRAERRGDADAGRAARRAAVKAMSRDVGQAQHAWLARASQADVPVRDRLTAFWADHFTVAPGGRIDRLAYPAYVHEVIRPYIMRRFSDMLRAVVTHPVMIKYLDQHISIGPNSQVGLNNDQGLNENLARELLELHTLGVRSGYTQTDISEFAELLTGLSVKDGGFFFRPNIAEPGAETVLGKSYGGSNGKLADIFAALDDLATRPETAAHIARKMAVHFVSDTPPPALVRDLEASFRSTGGDLGALTEILIDHPLALDQFGAKARTPQDFILSSIRALAPSLDILSKLDERKLNRIVGAPLRAMDHVPGGAKGPDGWPEQAEAWITPAGLATRISWAMAVPRSLNPTLPDPRDFVHTALGELATPHTRFAAQAAAQRWEGIGLVLASPEFNRR